MRFQLALNVKNLDESIAYYSKLFGVEVNKRKPGYANFAVDNPPLKLVLFENPDADDRLNHVGFEVDTAAEVEETIDRIEPLGLASKIIMDETCCYAEKSTVYAHDPQGLMWEFYKLRGDSETFGKGTKETPAPSASGNSCCSTPAPAKS
jgi:catechol 2,3-dioxygenase-like lactoylglutathione lyase family enzyme